MHRIDGDGHTADYKFTEGNSQTGVPPTRITDDWLNDMQEEVAGVIEDEGISLVKGEQTQLKTALNKKKRRSQTIIVASSDSKETSQKGADVLIAVSDDAGAAINALFALLPTLGGEIHLMEGTYNLTTGITIGKANVTISGHGDSTLIKKNAEIATIISVGYNYCKIKSLKIDGNKSGFAVTSTDGIVSTANYTLVDGCTIINCNRYGIKTNTDGLNTVSKNILTGNGNTQIYAGAKSYILDNIASDGAVDGIRCVGNSLVRGNVCEFNLTGAGITIAGSYSIITENLCSANGGSGIVTSNTASYLTISNNRCGSNTLCGIELNGGAFVTISANVCLGNGTNGILIGGSACDNTIVGNLSYSNTSTNIVLNSGSNYNIVQNNRTSSGTTTSSITNSGANNAVQVSY